MILYSNNCPRCEALKQILNNAGVQYEISDDMNVLISIGFQTVPVLYDNGVFMEFGEAVRYIKTIQKEA